MKEYFDNELNPSFDNKSHKIWKFILVESNYDCHELNESIKYASKKYNIPYSHYNGTGGDEHYHFDTIDNLSKFFNDLNIIYKYDEIDVDALGKHLKALKIKQHNMAIKNMKKDPVIKKYFEIIKHHAESNLL